MSEHLRIGRMLDSNTDSDSDFHYRRAEKELERAQCAEHPAAVKAHYLLAGYYQDRVYGPGGAEDAPDRSASVK